MTGVGYRGMIFRSAAAEAEVMADYDAILAEWPVPYALSVIPTRLGRTSVVSSGPKGRPHLVLLHGAGTHAMSWVGDIATFAGFFRTHVVDTPGDPGRSDAVTADRRTPVYADWLADVLDGLGVDRVHVAGISLGGWNALKFGIAYPSRTQSLVLLTPAGVRRPRLPFLLAAVPLLLLGRPGRRVVNHWIAGDALDRRALTYVDHLAADIRPRIDLPPTFSDDDLRTLRMPVLALVGARDVIFPARGVTERVRRLVPHATVKVIPDAGHALVGLAEPVVTFLNGATNAA